MKIISLHCCIAVENPEGTDRGDPHPGTPSKHASSPHHCTTHDSGFVPTTLLFGCNPLLSHLIIFSYIPPGAYHNINSGIVPKCKEFVFVLFPRL